MIHSEPGKLRAHTFSHLVLPLLSLSYAALIRRGIDKSSRRDRQNLKTDARTVRVLPRRGLGKRLDRDRV